MKLPKLLLIACALLLGAGVARAHAPASAFKHTSAKLRACDPQAHSALFQGAMRAHGKAVGLEMRLILKSRPLSGSRWARVGAPGFEERLVALPTKAEYIFDKGVANLPVGYSYRVVIRFRFRDAEGRVVARVRRRTRQCRQPDTRPNLVVTKLRPGSRSGDGMRTYGVTIENRGAGDAPAARLALDINGMRHEFDASGVAAGDTAFEAVEAPDCSPVTDVTATADAADAVAESDEADNAVTVPCGS